MIAFILLALVFIGLTAWLLARPFRTTVVEQENLAQAGQYALARDRLLRQLEQLETQSADGIVDKADAQHETQRLEIELAEVLQRLADLETAVPGRQMDREGKLVWWLALASFAVVLPLASLLMYGGWQADTLLRLAGEPLRPGLPADHLQTAATTAAPEVQATMQTIPPEALAMVARLESKLADNPNDGAGWKRLGRSYTVMGRYSEAVSAYTSAAELLPNDQEIQQALQQLAQVASSRGRHPEQGEAADKQAAHPKMPEGALEHIVGLERMVGENPKDAMSWARLGRAYINIERLPEAIRAYDKAYTLEPDNIVIVAGYAEAVFTNNPRDPDAKALELYTKLHEMNPQHPDGLWFLGLAAYSEGNLGRTRELWTDLLKVLPPDSEGYASVSNALAEAELLSKKAK